MGSGANVKIQNLRIPATFDDEFLKILNSQLKVSRISTLPDYRSSPVTLPTNTPCRTHGRTLLFANISGTPRQTCRETSSPNRDVKLQLSNIFFRLTKLLKSHQTSVSAITHCTLLLRDMKDFALINELYAKFFDFTNPPSRVTVAVGDTMAESLDIMLTAIAHPQPPSGRRNGLHVQSQSYWAPANIGPYSQAISVPLGDGYEIHIAGQIPLDPPSMTLYSKDGFKGEALLALQHLTRIGRTQNVKWWVAGVAMISATTESRGFQEDRVKVAQAVWDAVNAPPPADGEEGEEDQEDEEVVDAWDRKNFSKAFDDTVARSRIPDYRVFGDPDLQESTDSSRPRAPPCIVVEVDALPRYASIEWACTGLDVDRLRQTHAGVADDLGDAEHHRSRAFEVRDTDDRFAYSIFEIPEDERVDPAKMPFEVEYGTLYASSRFDWKDSSWAQSGISWIPCKRVWGQGGRELRGALVAKRG